MKKILLVLGWMCTASAWGQTTEKLHPIDPDVILQKGEPVTNVLMVGSFHFAYYGLDAHKTKEEDKINVLSPAKQKEMKELVDYIARFNPTKIAVEGAPNSRYLMKRYENYLQHPEKNKANEIDQLAFPLMKQFNLDTIYGVNDWGMLDEWYNCKDSNTIRPMMDSIYQDWDFRSNEKFSQRYDELYAYDDKLCNQLPLLDYFKYMNEDKVIARGFGAYLVGDFKNGTYEGADALAMHWYDRNLRIFRNIQNMSEPEDRVLVVFGAGHLTILKNLFESSPEFEVTKFGEL